MIKTVCNYLASKWKQLRCKNHNFKILHTAVDGTTLYRCTKCGKERSLSLEQQNKEKYLY